MKPAVIENVRIHHSGCEGNNRSLAFANGRITALGDTASADADTVRFDGGNRLLTPGLIDVHTHGIHRYAYETGPEDLAAGLEIPPRHGTTTLCPTLVRLMEPGALPRLEALANVLEQPLPVHVPGFHLEGPFLKLPGTAAATLDGDPGLLEEILAAARHRVVAMSVSPDTPEILPVIERLREHGIVPFITHTQADYEQTRAAIEAGARHATHFYDIFPPPPPTDEGVRSVGSTEALLEDPCCTVDFIADGVHVHPGAIRLALRCKGWRGVILITDSIVGAGLPDGIYKSPWDFQVEVVTGRGTRIGDSGHPKFGQLAGSALTMDTGINNLLQWLEIPETEVWAMGTLNPARLLGLENRKGTLAPGTDADFVLWDGDGNGYRPAATWVAGRLVWSREDFPLASDPDSPRSTAK